MAMLDQAISIQRYEISHSLFTGCNYSYRLVTAGISSHKDWTTGQPSDLQRQ